MSQPQGPSQGDRVTRIDAAHPIRSAESVEPVNANRELALVAAGHAPAHISEQIRTQASQLARHLRAKQQQIDRREALLNARIAQLERETRTSRLWYAERERVFLEREQGLEQNVVELREELKAYAVSELAADGEPKAQGGDLRQRETDLDARERRLCAGQMQVAEEAESLRVAIERLTSERTRHEREMTLARQELDHRQSQFLLQQKRLLDNLAKQRDALDQREQRLDQHRKDLGTRNEQDIRDALQQERDSLAAASRLLDEQTASLRDEREAFETEREIATESLRRERAVLDERQREMQQRFAQLRHKLTARQSTLQQRRGALEQMKQQVFELHRQTIEMRMVAEQLWQHAAKGKSIPELTQSLGSLRAQLADGLRISRDALSDKERQLGKLADNLNVRQRQLKRDRAELNQWLDRRNSEIEEQAARLVARDLELDAQQQAMRDREAAWRGERAELQARIRRLTTQCRLESTSAA